MSEKLSKDEVGILIQAKKIIRAKGFDKDVDISKICQTAGISRKTGYQWAERYVKSPEEPDGQISQKPRRLEAEHEALKKLYDDVRFENEGRKLAWEIHGVDEMLRLKKTLRAVGKTESGSFFRTAERLMREVAWILNIALSTLRVGMMDLIKT